MICLVSFADHGHRSWRQVMRVRGRLVVLKRLVVRTVVLLQCATQICRRRGANRRRCRDGARCRSEASLEPSPSDGFGVQQITDIGTCHRTLFGAAAIIVKRIWITDHCVSTTSPEMSPVVCVRSTVPVLPETSPGRLASRVRIQCYTNCR